MLDPIISAVTGGFAVGSADIANRHQEPKRQWIGLTDEERQAIYEKNRPFIGYMFEAIEAKLKEKNA